MKKASRSFVVLLIFVISAVALLVSSSLVDNNFNMVIITFGVLAVLTISTAFIDKHLWKPLRLSFLSIGSLFVFGTILGIALGEANFEIKTYCLILAIIEILNGSTELVESIRMVREKNYVMGSLMILDSLIEIVLGILMCIERDETLRLHIILISADLIFEGGLKFIDEFVIEKKGFKND